MIFESWIEAVQLPTVVMINALYSEPIKVDATEVGEDTHDSTGRSTSGFLNIDKAFIGQLMFGFRFKLCQQSRLITFNGDNIVVSALND